MRRLLFAWGLLVLGIWSLAQAQSPTVRAVILNTLPSPVSGGLTATIWNSSDQVGMTITGNSSGSIATNNNGAAAGVRAVDSLVGKQYWEVTLTVDASDGTAFGVSNTSFTLSGSIVGNADAAGYRSADANVFYNFGALISGVSAPSSGLTVGYAIDIPNKKIWTRLITAGPTCGNWDNTTDNPVGNVGGGDLTTLLGRNATIYPTVTANQFSNVLTGRFAAAGFLCAAPTGFGVVGH